jgi:hypothetical protein
MEESCGFKRRCLSQEKWMFERMFKYFDDDGRIKLDHVVVALS